MRGVRAIILLFAVAFAGPIHASQQFERNGLAIDGYDPVAYFT